MCFNTKIIIKIIIKMMFYSKLTKKQIIFSKVIIIKIKTKIQINIFKITPMRLNNFWSKNPK